MYSWDMPQHSDNLEDRLTLLLIESRNERQKFKASLDVAEQLTEKVRETLQALDNIKVENEALLQETRDLRKHVTNLTQLIVQAQSIQSYSTSGPHVSAQANNGQTEEGSAIR